MCIPGIDPLTLASMAAMAGGAAYNADTRNMAIEEQNKQERIRMETERQARERETARQLDMERQQAEAVTKALFEAAPEKVVEAGEAAKADPENPIVSAAEEYNVPVLQGQVQNEDVNENIGATVRKALDRTRGILGNAAALSGQNDQFSKAIQALGRMGSEVQTIGSGRVGSSRVAQMETSIPSARVTQGSSPLGDLLLIGGQIGAGKAGYNAGTAGGPKPFEIGNIFQRSKPLSAIPWA